jgi:hypothetical protein
MYTRRLSVLIGCAVAGTLPLAASAFDPMLNNGATSHMQRGSTPRESARPGETSFARGVAAVKNNDYEFAVNMYQVSASWAYKPAQYNLGVIYTKGEGVSEDKSLGLAWLALAAERGDKDYVAARDLSYSRMTDEEYARANAIWRDLRKTYGDEVALKRAKQRWVQVRNEATGSHVGGATGPMVVGGRDASGMRVVSDPEHPTVAKANSSTSTAAGITGPGAVDGSIAYRQMRESDNPYDPKFREPEGQVEVGDVIPVGDDVRRTPANGPKRYL